MNVAWIKEWLIFFEKTGCVYQKRNVDSWWEQFPHHGQDAIESLHIFLGGYAFERQGAPPSYAQIAGEALRQAKSRPLDPNEVWDLFKKESAGMMFNEPRNPLAPNGTEYKGKSGETRRTYKKSAIEFANELSASLIDWVHRELVNGAKDAHDHLCLISGVGPKIASYFMRDVACRYNCFPAIANDRRLLQPIDVWVRRAAEALGAPKAPDDLWPVADFIVEQSRQTGVSPERVNQGIWYFAAQIAETEYYLNKLLTDSDGITRARNDLRFHLRSLSSASSLLDGLFPL